MDILFIVVICVLIAIPVILAKMGKKKIKNFADELFLILTDPKGTMLENTRKAKDRCRMEPSIIAYFGYVIIDVFDTYLTNQEKNK